MNERGGAERRYAILTGGYLGGVNGKTAHGVIRYRPESVAAVIDPAYAGQRLNEVVPSVRCEAPIVASVADALPFAPTSLLVGVATGGGAIPDNLRDPILTGIDAGLEIVSGLHELLAEDPEIAARAAQRGVKLWDVRVPPDDLTLFSGAAYNALQLVVLAVGSDCAVGKMSAMLEFERVAREEGTRAEFLATGQTGILIAGKGIAVDRVIGDFISGAAERLVCEADPRSDVLLVEGQGAIFHPAYAPVTFGLLYGSAPDALVLCHRPAEVLHDTTLPIPSLSALVAEHESILEYVKPARVVAIVLDTSAFDETGARALLAAAKDATGLPADDVVRFGGAALWHDVRSALQQTAKAQAKLARSRN